MGPGFVTNVIPASVTLRFNVRFNDKWTPETLEDAVREGIESQDDEGCKVVFEIVGAPSRSFLSPLGGGVEILSEVIAAQTGSAPELSTGGGTSDARFIANYCPVAEFGLVGATMHQTDERVPVAELRDLAQVYHDVIAAFLA